MGLKFLQADENILWGASVVASSGTVATDYVAAWLCDGRNRPVKMTSGTATLTATPTASGNVGVVIAHSHNIDAARTITIGGGVSGTGAGPTARTNGIPVNPWIAIGTPATAGTVSIAVSGNTALDSSGNARLTIGELLAGRLRELDNDFSMTTFQWGYLDVGAVKPRNPRGSVVPYDRRLCARWLKGDVFCEAADRLLIENWYEGARSGSRPSALLPIHANNDAWVGGFSAEPVFKAFEHGWMCTLAFDEWVRKGW
jgi:hypothetical protein